MQVCTVIAHLEPLGGWRPELVGVVNGGEPASVDVDLVVDDREALLNGVSYSFIFMT